VEAAAHLLGDVKAAAAMAVDNPRAILEGEPLNPPEPGRIFKKQDC
jgi:hypothetical protein